MLPSKEETMFYVVKKQLAVYICLKKDFFYFFITSMIAMTNVFYLIWKALFVLEIFKFLWFFPFLSSISRFKRTNGSGIIYDVMNWLA